MADADRRGPSLGAPAALVLALAGVAWGLGALVSAGGVDPWGLGTASEGGGRPGTAVEMAPTPWPQGLEEIRFGVTPYLDEQSVEVALRPVVDYLAERIGVPVRLRVAESYAELGQLMRAQELDVAKFSPLSYVEAKRADPAMQILLTQVANGATSYLGYVYVRATDEAESLPDLQGRSFCYVDPHSTSGYLYPRALLRTRGLDPDTMFSRIEFGGNHLECLERVLEGDVDAGAAFSGALAAARHRGLEVFRLKIVGKTARIPYDAYCARSGLPGAAANRLKQELLRLSTRSPDGRRLIGGEGKFNAWTEAQDSDYDSVRQALALARQGSPEPG